MAHFTHRPHPADCMTPHIYQSNVTLIIWLIHQYLVDPPVNMMSCLLIASFIYIINSCDVMFTVFTGSHLNRLEGCLFTDCNIYIISHSGLCKIIINLDKGSIFIKGHSKKLLDMGPPYLCNNSNF